MFSRRAVSCRVCLRQPTLKGLPAFIIQAVLFQILKFVQIFTPDIKRVLECLMMTMMMIVINAIRKIISDACEATDNCMRCRAKI